MLKRHLSDKKMNLLNELAINSNLSVNQSSNEKNDKNLEEEILILNRRLEETNKLNNEINLNKNVLFFHLFIFRIITIK